MCTCTERDICIWDVGSTLLNVLLSSWCTINRYECNQSMCVYIYMHTDIYIDGIYVVSHTCISCNINKCVSWKTSHNLCVTGKHVVPNNVVLVHLRALVGVSDRSDRGHHWFLLPQPSKQNFLGTFLLLCILILSEASCNADLFCFATPLPPFQLLPVPVSLKLIML